MSDFDPATEVFHHITNRHGLKLFVKVIEPADQAVRGNCYLAHGFRDVHDTAHMRALTMAGVRAGYRVIIWDASHSWGRSEGDEMQATFYFHYEDLEDVLQWSRDQPWYEDKFVLGGHSLGGVAAGTYAAAHARQVQKLVLLSPVVSGEALRRRVPLPLQWWWRWRGTIRLPQSGQSRYSWEFIRSSWAYNLLADAGRLTMPVLLLAAGRDWIIPLKHITKLQKAIGPGHCRLVVMPGARHGFDRPDELARVTDSVRNWLGR